MNKSLAWRIGFIIFTVAILATPSAFAQTVDTLAPTIPTGLTATAGAAAGQATVAWTASTDPSDGVVTPSGVASYRITRDGIYLTTINTTSYVDTGLTPGLHSYTVVAVDTAGNSSLSSFPVNVLIKQNDTTAPSVPQNLVATSTPPATSSTAKITVTWDASTDDTAVIGYNVFRDNVNITLGVTTVTSASFSETLPPRLDPYVYTVSAYDSAGNTSAKSAPVSLRLPFDNVPPSIPGPVFANFQNDGIHISWKASTDEIGMKGYYLYRDGVQIASLAGTTSTDSGAPAGLHSYTVAAYDLAGNVSLPSGVATANALVDAEIPTPPTSLLLTPLTTSSLIFSWGKSFDDVGVVGYHVYRDDVLLMDTSSTSIMDTKIATGTHAYTAAAYDAVGNISNKPIALTVDIPWMFGTGGAQGDAFKGMGGAAATSGGAAAGGGKLTTTLSYGSRAAQVKTLQNILVARGYLSPLISTGYFGVSTLAALKKFQCDQKIICRGTAASTGWGTVGAKTRAALNK